MDIIGRHVSEPSGYAPAVPTPFDNDGNVDSAAFQQLCHRQIHQGATALVVCGTTGEAPTLNVAVHGALVRLAVGVARGRWWLRPSVVPASIAVALAGASRLAEQGIAGGDGCHRPW